MTKLLALSVALVLAGGLSVTMPAQAESRTEIATARAHALMAHGAITLESVHTHLHHVVNCLVGPTGQGFDAAAGNPCNGQGNGAIADAARDAGASAKLRGALADAQAGLKSNSLAEAQDAASRAAAALQATPAQKAAGGYAW